ncbi:MAG: alpha-2-macroglobulin family protein [Candidatus Pacebacteria bacterium]|nr:alpha-2-macroglobulin family protein [Candidatus Paceibacterota bacterium]
MDEFYKFPSGFSNLDNQNKNIKRKIKIAPFVIFILLMGLGIGLFFLRSSIFPKTAIVEFIPESYRLVPEKISQSAKIRILLPENIEAASAVGRITFNPEIRGKWENIPEKKISLLNIANAAENEYIEIYYKPDQDLELNRYYEVQLALSPDNILKEDFLAVENPEIVAVFPSSEAEAPESSEITIVFNRPIVPLTTLSELEAKDVPVEINPATKGKFKWITTSNLQFIPESGLIPSSNYIITIKPGFVSVDGLVIKGGTYAFTTRKLRLVNNAFKISWAYDKPFNIIFNQPVDLERTVSAIKVFNSKSQLNIPFTAQYYKNDEEIDYIIDDFEGFGYLNIFQKLFASVQRSLGIKNTKTQKGELNKSIIQIIPQADKFNRSSFWDFSQSYSITVGAAYPLEGSINMEMPGIFSFTVNDLIASIAATSDRTKNVNRLSFDPQGKLWITFYEEINISKSSIKATGLQNIIYGEKCSDPKLFLTDELCQKVEDKKKISLTFDPNLLGIGQEFDVVFEKLVNIDNLQLNDFPIMEHIVVYPFFEIYSAKAEKISGGDSLKKLSICSNNPIMIPEKKEDLKNIIKSDSDLRIIEVYPSYYISFKSQYYLCNVGEYETRVSYRLDPNKDYQITLALNDAFGQYKDKAITLKTGSLECEDRAFYKIQGYSNITSPKNTQLVFAATNLKYVNLNICKTTALSRLQDSEACQESEDVTLSLPNNYWIKNYFKVDISDYFDNPLGHYRLRFSSPDLMYQTYSYYDYSYKCAPYTPESYLSVTNMAVTRKQANTYSSILDPSWAGPNSLFWVNDINTLQPVQGAKISLYNYSSGWKSYNLNSSVYTDDQGIASASKEADAVIVTKGNDSTYLEFGNDTLNWGSSAYLDAKTYIYTDKPIYRPGETVHIKGICRVGYDGNYDRCNDYSSILNSLKITDSKYDEVANQPVIFNEFSTFSNEFLIDKASPLGDYRICLKDSDCGYFSVEEYKAAAFEVNVNSDKSEYVSKETGKFSVEANYYFGLPVEKSQVTYSLSTQNYYFDKYQDEYFSFDSGWYYNDSYYFGEKFLLRGETELSDQGKAIIDLDLDLSKHFKEKDLRSKIFVLDITVKTSQGQSVSAQKSFIVHAGDFYLGTYSDEFGLAKNQTATLKVKSVDKEGKPISISGLTMNRYSIDYVSAKRQDADGGYSYDWSVERKLLETSNISTDGSGNFFRQLKFDKEGEYEIEIVGKDKNGNLVSTARSFYVYGESAVPIQPYEGTRIDLKADKTDLSIGDTATVIIQSPYPNAKALISLERGKIFSYEIKEIKGNIYKYTFPIKEEYFPNVYLSVVLQSSDPELRYGNLKFTIGTKIKDVNVTVKTDKANYLPGEKVKLDITATDYSNQPIETDVSLAVIDLSVLALKGNPKKNPVQFFYGGFPLTITTGSNIKYVLEDAEKIYPNAPAADTKGGGGYEALEKKARGIFKDTAYWQSVVRTNSGGKAYIEFVLPDNLTTWQIEALGVTKNTQLGVGYSEFTSKKPLMVTILKPRFIIPGDVFEIGAKIFNQSLTTQKINMSFKSPTLTSKGRTEEGLTLENGKTKTIYFKVEAPMGMESGTHSFNVLAKGNDIEDQINESIKINPPLTFETTATAGYTNQSKWKEYIYLPSSTIQDKGNVTVKASATLGVFLSDSLNYLVAYPYGCSEQIASRLYAMAVVKKGLNLPNINQLFNLEKVKYNGEEYTADQLIQIGLNKLYNNQGYDGGFSYWSSSNASVHLTAYVLEALKAVKAAGFNVSDSAIDRAKSYLEDYLLKFKLLSEWDKDEFIVLSYALIDDSDIDQVIKNKLNSFAQDQAFISDKIGTESLAKLTIIMGRISGFKIQKGTFDIGSNILLDALSNRIKIDSRGAFLEPNNNISWFSYETTIKDTALYLKTVSLYKQDQAIIDKVLRWLLNSKDSNGTWRSTNNTLSVVDAMVEYIKFKKETESSFELNISLDNNQIKSVTFGSGNIFEQISEKIELNKLTIGKANTLQFSKNNFNNLPNNFYYDIALKYYLPAGQIAPRDEGISIERKIFAADDLEGKMPLAKAKVGDVLRVNLVVTIPKDRRFVAIEDFIPAGAEIVNMDLATEQKSLRLQETELVGREIYPNFKELRDDRAFIFKEHMYPGVYEFDYYIRAFSPGEYSHLPAMIYEMYTPENFGRSAGQTFIVEQT